jgi:hypothetical protein
LTRATWRIQKRARRSDSRQASSRTWTYRQSCRIYYGNIRKSGNGSSRPKKQRKRCPRSKGVGIAKPARLLLRMIPACSSGCGGRKCRWPPHLKNSSASISIVFVCLLGGIVCLLAEGTCLPPLPPCHGASEPLPASRVAVELPRHASPKRHTRANLHGNQPAGPCLAPAARYRWRPGHV